MTRVSRPQSVDPYAVASEQQPGFYELFDANDEQYHQQERKKLLHLVDWHLIPLLRAVYFMSFLDKNDVAQAKLAGLEKDLGLVGVDFNTATSIHFVGYILSKLSRTCSLRGACLPST
jgi:hypothetical protein